MLEDAVGRRKCSDIPILATRTTATKRAVRVHHHDQSTLPRLAHASTTHRTQSQACNSPCHPEHSEGSHVPGRAAWDTCQIVSSVPRVNLLNKRVHLAEASQRRGAAS